ncbi:MAG: aromatic amino acid transport family protein [Parachlamydiales bacterium]|jgi:tyrosine-specific transport protein
MKILKFGHVLGGAFLVAGTSIGAGMLALPVISSLGGFFPSLFIYLFSWIIMTITGLLFLEISLDMNKDSNIISMADRFLGKSGKVFSWIIYLFLFYCLEVAYISNGGELVNNVFNTLSLNSCIFIFTLLFGFFVYVGTWAVDRINIVLIFGLAVSYFLFVFLGIKHVDVSNLFVFNSKYAIYSFPIILISFGYQGMIPSLTYYMKKDYKKVRMSILLGTSIAFFIYLLWEFLILGIIPIEGKNGLKEALLQNKDAIEPLRYYTKIKSVYYIGRFFGFFAITTSFLGVSLGLFDFIADGFKIHKKGMNKILIALITFLPPLTITYLNPHIFITALNYAGGVGGALLLIFLPALFVFSKRYIKKEKSTFQVFGGKPLLIFIFVFVFFLILMQIFQQIINFAA